MQILWWEKTVEYYFVKKYVDLNMFVAPLDGNHEKVGDVIFANESSWVLIEFKRDEKSITDELDKFVNYAEAQQEFQSIDQHHLIIYGDIINGKFDLGCKRYFSGKNISLDKALYSGVDKDKFLLYLKRFWAYKKQSKGGSGGYGFVAGISSDGKVTKCMTLSEFAEAMSLQKNLQRELEQRERSGPEMDMDM